ncbi:MAG TPA: AAA family ATPase, partial [Candidatus Cybelea sp.]|nr:AAA family ATPase [Candidatus Cybelea sp.]
MLALFREAERTRTEGKKPNGDGKHVGEGKPVPELEVIDIRAWQGVEPKERAWIVRNMIPARNVTLLTGQGGVGKTLLMQQMSAATVLGKDWVGELPEPGPVLFITAEDDEDEMHHRYFHIARHYGVTFDELANAGLHLTSLAGRDATMAIADARGIVRPTQLFETWLTYARKIKPRWVGLDTAADIFVVNERDRSQVRQCISLLRGACLELDCAIILLAHPSLSGIQSGTGLSGSTAWNNSVRSRL